jgi:hypothetical protein
LPGYPVIKNLAPSTPQNFNQLPFDSVTQYSQPQVTRIVVDIIASRDFPRGQAGRATDVIKEVLGLSSGRDVVNITYRPFYRGASVLPKADGSPASNSGSQDVFSFQNILYITALLLFVIATIIYIFLKLKQIAAYKTMRPSGAENPVNNGGGQTVTIAPSLDTPSGGGSGSHDITINNTPVIKVYFDFVTENNIDNLVFILKKENIPVEQIAVIMSYLPPKLASKVFGELDIKSQAVVTSTLMGQRLVNRDFLDKLEAKVRNWLECLVGGQGAFQRLFSFVSGEVKKQLLTLLGQHDPKTYQAFRRNVLIFDDLRYLEDDEIKLVLSETNVDMLAASLISVDEETYQKIDINLSKSAKEMIQQFMDLKGTSISKQDIEAAQDYVLGLAERLEKEGKISLRSKIIAG